MEDIEIARQAKLKPITDIAKDIGIDDSSLECYGKYKAKINLAELDKRKNDKDGKLVLVTSINPTPLGEGKTTVAIGLADGLNRIGKKAILALREPSMGPVFGIKGGATGGGYAQVAPMEDINLHFTGDIHAITAANNLLSAIIDNHIFQGNELKIKKVTWKRCLDMNDRTLRTVTVGQSGERGMVERQDHFDISVASEIMAIFCLATSIEDLKRRLGNIVIGENEEGKPVTCRDLKADGSLTVLLKDALNPNLVQTLENNPAIIHGGPFANIAHGCNSVLATRLAMKLGDYCITEAGFGADLGAEKFLDIKTRVLGTSPDAVVIVATLKALKYHGGASKDEAILENHEALKTGIHNLMKHIDNILKYGIKPIVAINRYTQDTEEEIEILKTALNGKAEVSLLDAWAKGGEGATDLAEKVVNLCDNSNKDNFKAIYDLEDTIKEKIEKVATEIYGATGVEYSDEAMETLNKINDLKLPVCLAKTQYSLSDDQNNLLCEEPFTIKVREINVKTGAEFVVVILGKMMTMPGLPKVPAAEKIDIDENGNIVGLF